MKTFRAEVFGRVQGVNFRASVKKFCDGSGISGMVVNRSNGNVELLVQCSEDKLKELLKWLDLSPGFSKVENILFEEVDVDETFQEFSIARERNFIFDKFKGVENLGKRVLGGK
jgi:acylphosphatase